MYVRPVQQQLKPKMRITAIRSLKLQSYILSTTTETCFGLDFHPYLRGLQSYILSTTTETVEIKAALDKLVGFNRTSFQQQLKQMTLQHACAIARLQSYILSTTTET